MTPSALWSERLSVSDLTVFGSGVDTNVYRIMASSRQKTSNAKTRYEEITSKLAMTLGPEFISTRPGPGGKMLQYLKGFMRTTASTTLLKVLGALV